MTAKQKCDAIFGSILAEFPNRTWLENMAADSARSRLQELTEEQCLRIIAKAKLVLNG